MIVSIDVGIKNLAICVLKDKSIVLWKLINISYGSNMCLSIINELDDIYDIIKDSIILIERQMTKKMCNIQCYLEMYFRLKNFTSVIIYSPKYKLAGSGKENSGKGKQNYNARKKAAISLCEEWINKNKQNEDIDKIWKETKKKDDIADTLLMAISYLDNPIEDIVNIKKKIVARKPTLKQSKGKYSKSNIKYLLQQFPIEKRTELDIDKKLKTNINRLWKTFNDCINELEIEIND